MGTKYLKNDDDYILYKQKIVVDDNFPVNDLTPSLTQETNSKLLNVLPIHHLVYLYQWGKKNLDTAQLKEKRQKIERKYNRKIEKAEKQKKIDKFQAKKLQKIEKIDRELKVGNQRMRWGEELVVLDSTELQNSRSNLKNTLFSNGYFNAEVIAEVETKKKQASVTYKITEGNRYVIDSLIYNISDKAISKIFFDNIEAQKLKGEPYAQSLFSDERERVYNLMSNNGYFNFKRQYVLFEVDSTILDDYRLVIRQSIANPPGKSTHKAYRVDSIIFSTESDFRRTKVNNPVVFDHITYNVADGKYPEKHLGWRIFLEKDSLYQKNLTLETQRQLSYLDIFKFVNINYDSTGGKFIANIFTSPLDKFQTSTEVGLSVLDQARLPGPFFNFSAKSRNVFGGLEIFQFDGNASIQGISSVQSEDNTYSRLQYGGNVSVTFPQFLFPLNQSIRSKIGRYNPRTKLGTGVNFEDRRGEYKRRTFNSSMSYIWQIKDEAQFTVKPFDLSYINSDNSDTFNKRLEELKAQGQQSLASAFNSSVVLFSSFGYSYNNNNYGVLSNADAFLVGATFETGGNLESVLGNNPFPSKLENYKYLKSNIDFRKTDRLTRKSALAYRFHVGIAYPYGNNRALPYEKYYFAGGSNSIRAWEPRRLGPGAFGEFEDESSSETISVDTQNERLGDIILESSIEYRHDLIGFVDYALFIDAGNIWLWNSETVNPEEDEFGGPESPQDDGVFDISTFGSEIAVGAGFGFRFDFSFLILRLDVAYKVMDPAYPKGERFLLGNYQIKDLWNFQDAANLNIGIGYPF